MNVATQREKVTALRKKIVIGYCILMAVAAMYVPWKIDTQFEQFSFARDSGYSLVCSKPYPPATIDYGKILLEFVVISAIAGVLYVLSEKRENK